MHGMIQKVPIGLFSMALLFLLIGVLMGGVSFTENSRFLILGFSFGMAAIVSLFFEESPQK